MVKKRVREGFYLYPKRQNDPSWMDAKCCNTRQSEDLKEVGHNFRVLGMDR
jgi:hypothetical protein